MSVMMGRQNPYMAPIGLVGTRAGLDKYTVVQKAVTQLDGKVSKLQASMQNAQTTLEKEVSELRTQNDLLQRKLNSIESLLSNRSNNDNDDNIINVTEVRLIVKNTVNAPKGLPGTQNVTMNSNKPTVSDLTSTSLLGKIRLLQNATFGDARRTIMDDFDDDMLPKKFKFYTVWTFALC